MNENKLNKWRYFSPNNYEWFDCTCDFICECGKEIQLISDEGLTECSCGRMYRLKSYVEVSS